MAQRYKARSIVSEIGKNIPLTSGTTIPLKNSSASKVAYTVPEGCIAKVVYVSTISDNLVSYTRTYTANGNASTMNTPCYYAIDVRNRSGETSFSLFPRTGFKGEYNIYLNSGDSLILSPVEDITLPDGSVASNAVMTKGSSVYISVIEEYQS